MKPFNLQEYLDNPSRKVVTRDGRQVRILCTNAKNIYPIVALVDNGKRESTENYMPNGRYLEIEECGLDLFFTSEKREGWVNIYRIPDTKELEASCIFSTKEEAEFYRGDEPKPNYVATTRIEWKE